MQNDKQTIEEVKRELEEMALPDVTVQEILTLVREPLAHLAFKTEAGDYVRVFTQGCAFMLHLPSLRIMVDAPVMVRLNAASKAVKRAAVPDSPVKPKKRRGDKEPPAPDVRPVVHPAVSTEPPDEEIDESLERDTEAVVRD